MPDHRGELGAGDDAAESEGKYVRGEGDRAGDVRPAGGDKHARRVLATLDAQDTSRNLRPSRSRLAPPYIWRLRVFRSYAATATLAACVRRFLQPTLLVIGVSRSGLMGKLPIMDALRNKRPDLVGLMSRLEQQLVQHRGSLAHLDATIRLWRWCTWPGKIRITPSPKLLCHHRRAMDGVRTSGRRHPIPHRHAHRCPGLLGSKAVRSKPWSDQRFVASHCRFYRRTLAVASRGLDPFRGSTMADDDAACGQQFVHHAQAERVAEVEPDRMADDLSRETVAGVAGNGRRCRPARLPGSVAPRKPRGRQVDGASLAWRADFVDCQVT